jgi:hypothetical protein
LFVHLCLRVVIRVRFVISVSFIPTFHIHNIVGTRYTLNRCVLREVSSLKEGSSRPLDAHPEKYRLLQLALRFNHNGFGKPCTMFSILCLHGFSIRYMYSLFWLHG